MSTTATIQFSNEQGMLLDIASKFFKDKVSIDDVRLLIEDDAGFSSDLWREMAEAGWLGLAVPEEYGGTGMGLAELVPIVEPMGRSLCPSPFVATQLAIQGLLASGSEALQSAWLGRLAEGAVGTVALFEPDGSWLTSSPACTGVREGERIALSGTKTLVEGAAVAEVALVSVMLDNELALLALDRDQIAACAPEREVVIDETRRSYRLALDGVSVAPEAVATRGREAVAAIERAALLLICAESCGGIAGALDVIVEYLKTRTQFGRQIGSYQALKHPAVDILCGLERSRSHLFHAATNPTDEVALRMAKAESGDSFVFAGDRGIQFHGGFGFTYECDAQLFLRRALWCQFQFGDAPHQRGLLADLVL